MMGQECDETLREAREALCSLNRRTDLVMVVEEMFSLFGEKASEQSCD